jgi:hypothetical protein
MPYVAGLPENLRGMLSLAGGLLVGGQVILAATMFRRGAMRVSSHIAQLRGTLVVLVMRSVVMTSGH